MRTEFSDDVMNRDQLSADCAGMLFASLDATSATTKLALCILCRYPELQDVLHKEINDAFNGNIENIYGAIVGKKLNKLQAFIHEVMRFYPAAHTGSPRRAIDDIVVDGYVIPKGYAFGVNIIGINRNTKFWKNASEFDINNFLNDNGRFVRSSSFVNFGLGNRNCIGNQLALKVLYAEFVFLISKYKFTANGENGKLDFKVKVDVHLKPVPEVPIAFIERK